MSKAQIIILVGIPTAGKSTWAYERYWNITESCYLLSRDRIREQLFGKKYHQNKHDEEIVTKRFYQILNIQLQICDTVILDNTHCHEKYITEIVDKYPNNPIEVKFFDLPLYEAYFRNVKRYLLEGKWIPFKVIKSMHKNYLKINQNKYE